MPNLSRTWACPDLARGEQQAMITPATQRFYGMITGIVQGMSLSYVIIRPTCGPLSHPEIFGTVLVMMVLGWGIFTVVVFRRSR